jgi:hypothetical protein
MRMGAAVIGIRIRVTGDEWRILMGLLKDRRVAIKMLR